MPSPHLITRNTINRLQRIDLFARVEIFYGMRKNCRYRTWDVKEDPKIINAETLFPMGFEQPAAEIVSEPAGRLFPSRVESFRRIAIHE